MKRRIINIVIVLITCIFLFGLYFYLNYKYGFGIPCVFHKITGYYCPGCGITRLLFSLVKLDFYEAFKYNQLVFILLPFFIFLVIYKGYLYLTNKKDELLKKIPNVIWIILAIIVIAFGVVRNIDFFDFLRP